MAGVAGQAFVHGQPTFGAQRCEDDHALRPPDLGYPEDADGFGKIFYPDRFSKLMAGLFSLDIYTSLKHNVQKMKGCHEAGGIH